MPPPPLRIALVDMNNGVANQATRCFRRIVNRFAERVRERNPGLEVTFTHLQPRNLEEAPAVDDVDLVLSSGGPGSPLDGFDDRWCRDYRAFLDAVVERNLRDVARAPKLFVVCHSFEIATIHFAVAEVRRRATRKFGVMPAYLTASGQDADFLQPFGYRLFSWEHRDWEAVNLDASRGRWRLSEEPAWSVGDRSSPGVHRGSWGRVSPEADRRGRGVAEAGPDAVHGRGGSPKRMMNSLNTIGRATFANAPGGSPSASTTSESRGRAFAAPFDAGSMSPFDGTSLGVGRRDRVRRSTRSFPRTSRRPRH